MAMCALFLKDLEGAKSVADALRANYKTMLFEPIVRQALTAVDMALEVLFAMQHYCNTVQHTATHCNTLQHTATHCNTLLHSATQCDTLQHAATQCNTLQQSATHCNTRLTGLFTYHLHCNTLQHAATLCNRHFDMALQVHPPRFCAD